MASGRSHLRKFFLPLIHALFIRSRVVLDFFSYHIHHPVLFCSLKKNRWTLSHLDKFDTNIFRSYHNWWPFRHFDTKCTRIVSRVYSTPFTRSCFTGKVGYGAEGLSPSQCRIPGSTGVGCCSTRASMQDCSEVEKSYGHVQQQLCKIQQKCRNKNKYEHNLFLKNTEIIFKQFVRGRHFGHSTRARASWNSALASAIVIMSPTGPVRNSKPLVIDALACPLFHCKQSSSVNGRWLSVIFRLLNSVVLWTLTYDLTRNRNRGVLRILSSGINGKLIRIK